MIIEKTRNAKRNIIYGIGAKTIYIIAPFLTRTVVIKALGADYLGLDSVIISILSILNLAELGFNSAVVYALYRPIAEDNFQDICATVNFLKKIYRNIGIIVLIVGGIILPVLPRLINDVTPPDVNIYIIYIIYLVNNVIGYSIGGYRSVILEAFQRRDIIDILMSTTKIVLSILQVILVAIWDSYLLYVLVIPITTFVYNILVLVVTKAKYPIIQPYGEISDTARKKIKQKVAGLFLYKIGSTSRNSFDTLCISTFVSLTAVTIYNNYLYIFSAVVSLLSIVTNSIVAAIGNDIVKKNVNDNFSTFRKLNFLYMWIVTWAFCCMLCLYQPFMHLWVGKELMLNSSTMLCICIYFFCYKMSSIRGVYSDALGLWWENRFRTISEAVGNILLNVVLVQIWGVIGVIVATIVTVVVFGFWCGARILFNYYFGKERFRVFIKDEMISLGVCVIAGSGTYTIANFVNSNNSFVNLLFKFFICVTIPNLVLFILYFRTSIYNESIEWFRYRIIGKRRELGDGQ